MTPRSGAPTPPIALAGGAEHVTARLRSPSVDVPDDVVARLAGACAEVTVDPATLGEASRDWWPLAMTWALESQVASRATVVARPGDEAEVAAVAAICHEARIPLTAAAGRSGVCGNSVPVFGGVVLDLCGLSGIVGVDGTSMVVDVAAGTFGDRFEDELQREHGFTVGHWPQSMALSTVGGWVACRGAGQYSTRYGKIEDMVVGLDVVLADGRSITTGGQPRQAVGPDLTQVFVGSEGTLGIVTSARLRLHDLPDHQRRLAVAFDSFADGLDACRRILRRGATPAVLRLYDAVESKRNFSVEGRHALIVLDEGDPAVVDGMWDVVEAECAAAEPLDVAIVEGWLAHRNDVSQLESLIAGGVVVDTMEVAAPWNRLDAIYDSAMAAIKGVEATVSVSAHQSHAYPDGACLYFTFAGRPTPDVSGPDAAAAKQAYYLACWDAGTRAVLAHGGALSHHHGVGLNRARFVADALGGGFDVLRSLKDALDPHGILNPGKLGLPSPFGDVAFPELAIEMDGLVWNAIWRAGLSLALLFLPVALVMEALDLTDVEALPFFAVILFLGAVGGFGAAKPAPERPLPNGAVAAAFGYVLVQGIGVIRHLVTGEDSTILTYVFLTLLMATCGMLGAMVERRTRVMR